MTRKKAWTSGAAVAVALVTSALSIPTAAAVTSLDQLTLSITPVSGGVARQVTLLCEPTGGNHPDAAAACKDLIAGNGDIAAIPPQTGVACPLVVMPVNAQATGQWEGRPLGYSKTFTNSCFANIETGGHVFHF